MTVDAASITRSGIPGSGIAGSGITGSGIATGPRTDPAATDPVPPPIARRRDLTPSAALSEEIRDSVRLLAGCLGAAGAAAVFLHFVTVWAG
jgi:hypothetical protein